MNYWDKWQQRRKDWICEQGKTHIQMKLEDYRENE